MFFQSLHTIVTSSATRPNIFLSNFGPSTSTLSISFGTRMHSCSSAAKGHALTVCIVVVVLCVLLCVFAVLCVYCCFYLDAGLLARSQYSEGPATGHLDTGFSWFPCA